MSQYVAPVGQAPVTVCVNDGSNWTVLSTPGADEEETVLMWNARFCQKMLFCIKGFENFVHCE